jgi:hypothetical protein
MTIEPHRPLPLYSFLKDKPIRGMLRYGVTIDDAWFPSALPELSSEREAILGIQVQTPRMNQVDVSPMVVDPMPLLLALRR